MLAKMLQCRRSQAMRTVREWAERIVGLTLAFVVVVVIGLLLACAK